MSSRAFRTFRRLAAALLVAAVAVLACAAPASAMEIGRNRSFHAAGDPAPSHPWRSFFSFLLQLFEEAGGGMDPNGLH
ncbi:MAG TPA: hypothetical protein VGH73_18340 [Thermoanaerobaculia bacterium]|jgi:hypothetical protein